ncbi:MAG: glycosyltransferase [Oscillospiraceae bacterium]
MVFVVTAVHNRKHITERFLGCLLEQADSDQIRLIIVDDGSVDGTSEMVREKYAASTILQGGGNSYWGGSLQKAYQYLIANGIQNDDIVLYANDDSVLSDDYIRKLTKILSKHPNALVTGCGYGKKTGRYLDGPVSFNFKSGAVKLLPAGDAGNCASTRALGMTGEVFRDIGGFHPILLPHYASDYEYTIRAFRKGHPIISDTSLRYVFTEETTGDNSHRHLSFKKIMSKRSKLNPIYKLNFILLIAPFYRLPFFIFRQIKQFKHHQRDEGKSV